MVCLKDRHKIQTTILLTVEAFGQVSPQCSMISRRAICLPLLPSRVKDPIHPGGPRARARSDNTPTPAQGPQTAIECLTRRGKADPLLVLPILISRASALNKSDYLLVPEGRPRLDRPANMGRLYRMVVGDLLRDKAHHTGPRVNIPIIGRDLEDLGDLGVAAAHYQATRNGSRCQDKHKASHRITSSTTTRQRRIVLGLRPGTSVDHHLLICLEGPIMAQQVPLTMKIDLALVF